MGKLPSQTVLKQWVLWDGILTEMIFLRNNLMSGKVLARAG